MAKLAPLVAVVALLAQPATAQPATTISPVGISPLGITIVAAENFYGDVAQQVAGSNATVTSILSNPDQDPHLFEASPSVARVLSDAAIVVYNGADYDPWMTKLLAASRSPNRKVIIVADLVHRNAGENPHLWYDPPTMPAYAKALADALADCDPARRQEYQQRLATFLTSLQPLEVKIADLRSRFAGTPVTATEPVAGYLATALGFKMRNERFQLAAMNDTEPRVSDIGAFESDLRKHSVKLLFYNSQATDAAAQRLVRIARQVKVPVVGVTETEPHDRMYQDWMMGQVDAIAQALAKPAS
jgi:zinc/manganese transport system substrate-binding protein